MILKRAGLFATAVLVFAASTVDVSAGPGAEIPPQFRGAGCNLKYAYTKTPKADASECIYAKADHKEGDAHDNDNFIRITKDNVAGVEWGCTVKSVKAAGAAEFTFVGDCGEEGTSYPAVVTLLMRPGNLVIVDVANEGLHTIDIYHLLDGLQ
jgi:hypothetical protein